jgi:serine/threonine protein kinase
MAEQSKCPHCGKPVPAGAPGGLCPEWMVKAGIGSEAGTPQGGLNRPGSPPPSLEAVARHFPQLEIIELLGSGGMGAVYKARQREIDRLVALKILPPEAAGDPGFAERFTREARALAKLSHPNIVALHEFGHVDGLHYFIMEFVDGLNLRQLEQAGKLSPREALQIIPQICEALQFAHDEGIVHRDIKPENVLLDKKGRVKIADFGLARILGHEPEDFRLTRAREVMGTLHYMAPEQVEKPQSVDHRADIFSLGVVFYEMLTGELPLGKFAPPSQKVQIDVRLDEVVLRALEKEPARRYQQASEVKTDMETIMTQQPSSTITAQFPPSGPPASSARFSRVGVIAAIAAVLALAGILAWVWKVGNPPDASKLGAPVVHTKLAAYAKPEESNRWYYVSGEVRTPNRCLYNGQITLLRAIASASDFTDFADKTRVQVTGEDGRSQIVDCVKALDDSSLDSAIRPGDKIFVGRRTDSSANPAIPSLGTNVNSDQRASEAFARRYGLSPSATSPPGPVTDSAEAAFARRYGLTPQALSSESNATFIVGSNRTAPLSYQWYFGTNKTTGITAPAPEGLVITKLTPLYLKLTFESVIASDSGPRYGIGVENQAGADPRRRVKRQYYRSLNTSGLQDIFTLREAKAAPDDPTNVTVVLELKDSGERVKISKDHSFQRVDGYAADLSYEAEKKTWINRRVGSALRFGGDEAQIIAITRTEVVMGAKSSGKTWAIEYKGVLADPSGTPGSGAGPKQP